MKDDLFYIENLEEFLEKVRRISFEKFVEINDSLEKDEFIKFQKPYDIDKILSISETKNIAMPMIKKEKDKYVVSNKKLYKIIENLNSRMISNSLINLVSSGVIESAYDSELNDFVFWIK